ncbi:MAG: ATP-binding protein, partial [Phycisphaerae bacterium]
MAKKELTISLAAKCQLLFGFAVLVIIAGALAVPWQRMEQLTSREPVYEARLAADMALRQAHVQSAVGAMRHGNILALWRVAHLRGLHYPPPVILPLGKMGTIPHAATKFDAAAIKYFLKDSSQNQYGALSERIAHHPVYQYAAAVRASVSCLRCHTRWRTWLYPDTGRKTAILAGTSSHLQTTTARPRSSTPRAAAPLVAVVHVSMPVTPDLDQLLLNRVVIVVSGLIGGSLAIVVFYLITTRLILQPVRVLRNTAEKVARGDLDIRSAISTGDEFEQLSDTFNIMLATLKASQDQLEATNRSLDTRVGELAQSNTDLFQTNKMKSEFLTNVSHELRTPLNAIIGFAELLATAKPSADDPRWKRYIDNILTSARQLLDLINDLLDLAKIEAGKMVLRLERINVPDVCESLVNFMRPLAQKKNIELSLLVQPPIPLVTTDPARFQQILYNFLSNAIKFTPEDGHVRITVTTLEAKGVKISVTDTGPGIAPEHHAAIFEKFNQLDASVTRRHGGTGLGLTISHELAAMLHATIELVSEVGKGATFSLLIPIAPPD